MFARCFQILAVSAAFSTALIGSTSAADKRRVCSGEWTDMRRIGLSIGDCDLNDISDADLDYVHRRCGEPWGPWKNEQRTGKTCIITVIAGPRKPNARGAPVYPVRKVVRS